MGNIYNVTIPLPLDYGQSN